MDLTMAQKLCDVLDGHLERYQALVDYVAQEKKYLLAQDLDGLFASSKMKEALAMDIQANIHELVEAITETALMLGLPAKPQPLLADLGRRLPRPYDNHVIDGALRLERLKNLILRENEENRRFIEEALRLAGESINILTGANRLKGEGYNNDGSQAEARYSLPTKLSKAI